MLQLKDIVKIYKSGDSETRALDGVSVNFVKSEFVAVLGESGSGKTTLLNVIGGLDHYDSGDLIINGISTKHFKDNDWDAYRNHQVGFVFQNYHLIPHQSILSNVELALTLSGVSRQERKKRAIKALKDVGLGKHVNKMPNQLSGGQMQRVAIARALVNNPSIIFADEPTGALDTKTSVQIMDILKGVSENKLVVMVTHNPKLAAEYATRTVKLSDGKIVGDSTNINLSSSNKFCALTNEDEDNKNTIKYPDHAENKNSKGKDPSLSAENPQTSKNIKQKTSMSFLTALELSFSNLMGKKGRTFLTAFAGSIGIIGIAAILALSNGTQLYINQVENNTLSQYPLTISKTKSIMGGVSEAAQNGSLGAQINKLTTNQNEGDNVAVRSTVSLMLGGNGTNDLKSLKSYLDTNPDNFNEYTKSVEYSYNTQPIIYSNFNGDTQEVYPSSIISSATSSSGLSSTSSSASAMGVSSKYSMLSSFSQLPQNQDIYKEKYNIAAGHWPTNNNECVLVLHQDGTISDNLLYTLGLRDNEELKNAILQYSQKEAVSLPTEYEDVNYNQILGKTFKVVCPANLYQHNNTTNTWTDMTEDKEFVKNAVNSGHDLKIVGIINAPQGNSTSLTLTAGINYPYELNEQIISEASQTEIVKQQLSNPSIDVLTGKPFGEKSDNNMTALADMIKIDTNALNDVFSFNTEGLDKLKSISDTASLDNISSTNTFSQEELISIITNSITEEDITNLIKNISTDQSMSADITNIVTIATKSYINYLKEHPTESVEHYFSKDGEGYKIIQQACAGIAVDVAPIVAESATTISKKLINNIVTTLSASLQNSAANLKNNLTSIMSSLDNLDVNYNFSSDKLSDALKFDFSQEKLLSLAKLIGNSEKRTYESNLSSFGYADMSNPTTITIYPSNFDGKEKINSIIDDYNSNQPEDKQISYTDFAKLLMTSITTMINMITAVLIAFVAISLVVSSIMIGIITYISVLERRREIGILRAIGARKRDIFRVFNAETFIVGAIAGLIGIGITLLGCIPANILAKKFFTAEYDVAILPVWAALSLILVSVTLTLIAGLIPSASASKKDPVEAINS